MLDDARAEPVELEAHVARRRDPCPRASRVSTARPGRGRPGARGSPPPRSPCSVGRLDEPRVDDGVRAVLVLVAARRRRAAGARRPASRRGRRPGRRASGAPSARRAGPGRRRTRSPRAPSSAARRPGTAGSARARAGAGARASRLLLRLERRPRRARDRARGRDRGRGRGRARACARADASLPPPTQSTREARREPSAASSGSPPVGAAADLDEVARARVHRQPRLDRVPAVVPLDQLVHLAEVPRSRSIRRQPAGSSRCAA